jgi:fumarylacetoacetase
MHHSDLYSFDINLAVSIKRNRQNIVFILDESNSQDFIVSKTNFKYLYWTLKQQLAHHASNGCNIRPGNLIGSGTVSDPVLYAIFYYT